MRPVAAGTRELLGDGVAIMRQKCAVARVVSRPIVLPVCVVVIRGPVGGATRWGILSHAAMKVVLSGV